MSANQMTSPELIKEMKKIIQFLKINVGECFRHTTFIFFSRLLLYFLHYFQGIQTFGTFLMDGFI